METNVIALANHKGLKKRLLKYRTGAYQTLYEESLKGPIDKTVGILEKKLSGVGFELPSCLDGPV